MSKGSPKSERGPYARGVQKKRELLQAVLRLVAREGVRAVTHRAVAAEAETSLRSTTYYFATKEDMIREAFRFFVARSLERVEDTTKVAAAQELDFAAGLDLMVEQIRSEYEDPDTSWAAEFELVLAIAREPALAPEYRKFQSRLDKRLEGVMKDLGSPKPVRDARIVLAFLRGFELEQLSRPDRPISLRTLRTDLERLVRALVAVD